MATVVNGTSRYDIKDFFMSQIAPKYFEMDKVSDLTVGLFGYINDSLSEVTNDTYFTVASLYKETFPQLAELNESIYDHALIYQLSNVFATPSAVNFTLVVPENTILENGENAGGYSYFNIDSTMVININDVDFMLDYDIRLASKNTTNGWVHSAQYIIDKENAISSLTNPYIKCATFKGENGSTYIAMHVILHQVTKKSISDTILSNDAINAVKLEYTFRDSLANFDVYYKAPGAAVYTQLKKLLADSGKIDDPFCYYKLVDENRLQISFTTDDSYFQPEYNSDIIIDLYTTIGAEGNFDEYVGDRIEVKGKFDRYPNNRGVVFMGNVVSGATGGKNAISIDELKNETIKAYSTMKTFSTTNDLNLYFDEIRENNNQKSQILFMRKRDDCFERLYSAYILFRDRDNNVLPTNTLDVRIKSTDVDVHMQQTGRNIVKAGKLYQYYGDVEDPYAGIRNDLKYTDNLDIFENTNQFIYVNPFLTIIGTNPLDVGFYLNTISDTLPLTSVNITTNSFYQFIIDNLTITRDALLGSDEYTFEVQLNPTATLPFEAFKLIRDDTLVPEDARTFHNDTDDHDYIDNENLKVVLEVMGDSGTDRKFFVLLELYKFDNQYYYFKGSIKTNDYISVNGKIQIVDGFRLGTNFEPDTTNPILIPATNCLINVYALYKYPDGTITKESEFNGYELLKDFSLTDKYSLMTQNYANFAIPIQEIRSYVEYSVRESSGKYGFRLEAVPLIKANYLKIDGVRDAFLENFNTMYEYLEASLQSITNNYSIDMKFFNTYGYSNHYCLINNPEEHIDKVNIKLHYAVKFNTNANSDSEAEELKSYIKSLVEESKLSLVSSPSFYCSTISTKCQNKFSNIVYMNFIGMNEYDATVQGVESDVNEYNIINGVINTSSIIPEYLNIDFIIKDGERTAQVYIDVV